MPTKNAASKGLNMSKPPPIKVPSSQLKPQNSVAVNINKIEQIPSVDLKKSRSSPAACSSISPRCKYILLGLIFLFTTAIIALIVLLIVFLAPRKTSNSTSTSTLSQSSNGNVTSTMSTVAGVNTTANGSTGSSSTTTNSVISNNTVSLNSSSFGPTTINPVIHSSSTMTTTLSGNFNYSTSVTTGHGNGTLNVTSYGTNHTNAATTFFTSAMLSTFKRDTTALPITPMIFDTSAFRSTIIFIDTTPEMPTLETNTVSIHAST